MKHLIEIQKELKAPKGKYNSFGKYKYRSCEDILEAVKPICHKHGCLLLLSDKPVQVGCRYYIEATATLKTPDAEFAVTASARESLEKKGMDSSQITGTASSYARKYALNGLFNIDDTKDADTDEYRNQQRSKTTASSAPIGREALEDEIVELCNQKNMRLSDVCKTAGVNSLMELPEERLQGCIKWIQAQ